MAYNNSIDLNVTGVVTASGTGTWTGSAVTQYEVVLGDAANALTNVSGTGTLNQYLASNGAAAAPTWKTLPGAASFSINVQTFTTSGTYTPTANMVYAIIEVVGGGGGGGAVDNPTASQGALGDGGGAGGYARLTASSATIGASQTVTVGAAGIGGTAGPNAGTAGGTTSFGTLVQATGGQGGAAGISQAFPGAQPTAGGVGSSGNLNANGAPSIPSIGLASSVAFTAGGGSSLWGGAGLSYPFTTSVNGSSASNYGSGGSGGGSILSTNNASGGNGSAGICIVTEYIFI